MALNLASPGIVVREVDLTVGRVNPTSDKTGAIAGPFAQGPVNEPTLIETEKDLVEVFGEPRSTDKQYEYWLSASSYLAYGGVLNVVRTDDSDLKNAFSGTASDIKIQSLDDYNNLQYDENAITGVTVAARNPGSWANGIKVALIDAKADQIINGFDATDIQVGYAVTQAFGKVIIGSGSTSLGDGFLRGVVTGVGNSTLDVKVLSHVSGCWNSNGS